MTLDDLKREAEADGWRVIESTTGKSVSFDMRDGPSVHYDMFTERVNAWKPGDWFTEYTVSGVASIPAVLAILKGLLPKSQEPTMIDDDPEQHDAEACLESVKKHAAAGGTIVVSPALARRCGVDVFTLHGLAKGVGYASRVHLVKMPY